MKQFPTYHETLVEAEFQRRQDRETHPRGRFDKQHRWYPSVTEARPCCTTIRPPARAWPYSLLLHCRSRRHVRQLMTTSPSGIDLLD